VTDVEIDCTSFANGCFTFGESYRTRDVSYRGVLVHKFVPFGTIRQRVQIGMNFAGGIGQFEGTAERHEFFADFVSFTPGASRPNGRQVETITIVPIEEELFTPFPLGKVQIAGAVIVAPGFKVRVAGGLDFPGTSVFSLTGVYLFGAR
jgi:hypothetical protein